MSRLNAEFSNTTLTAFGLAAVVTLLSFLIAVLLARRLTGPLERLTRTVNQVSDGDYSVRPVPTSSGEIRDLTETFITMLDKIEAYSTRMEDLVSARTDALERANSVMVKELKLAQKIQDALIPSTFPVGPLTVAGAYLPMEDLGGDFYDVFEGAPGEWTVVMADVSGHGVPAALVTAMVKISLGLHGPQNANPGKVLEQVNRELCAAIGDLRRYVTMVLCHIDVNKGTLAYCNAGHNELVLVRGNGERQLLGPNSGVVGLWPDELFLTRSLTLAPGDSLVLFTDGLVEGRGPNKKEFGLERFYAVVDEAAPQGPQALVDSLSAEFQSFAQGQPQQDDVAFLAVRWEAAPAARSPIKGFEPQDSAATLSRAEDLYRANSLEVLLAWTGQKLAEAPQAREASRLHHWRAMGLHSLGRYSEARDAWNRAVATDEHNLRAKKNLSLLERHLKEVQP